MLFKIYIFPSTVCYVKSICFLACCAKSIYSIASCMKSIYSLACCAKSIYSHAMQYACCAKSLYSLPYVRNLFTPVPLLIVRNLYILYRPSVAEPEPVGAGVKNCLKIRRTTNNLLNFCRKHCYSF